MTGERRAGFSLIELMVSTAIVGIVVVYMMQSFLTQQRTFVTGDQVSEAQQNLRGIADLLDKELREAGYMVPEHGAACGVDATSGPDTLYVSDGFAVAGLPDPPNPADPLTDRLKRPDLGVQLLNSVPTGAGTLIVSDLTLEGRAVYDVDANGIAESDFQCATGACAAGSGNASGGVIVIDAANPERGVACGSIEAIRGNNIAVVMEGGLGAGGSNTEDLRVIPAHVYEVVANDLYRDRLLLANDVEDLQIAWFIDRDNDGDEDLNEYRGDGTGPDYDPKTAEGDKLREIRMNVVARTRAEDDKLTGGMFQATENRNPVAGTDGFRRRVLGATVRPRTLGTRS